MRILVFTLVSALMLANIASAGAWMRGEGQGFVAISATFNWPQDIDTLTSSKPTDGYRAIYFEYGLSKSLTLGVDLGRSMHGSAKNIAFLQIPLRNRDTGLKAAAALGFGTIDDAMILRPALSLGYGLKSGWLTADTMAEVQTDTGQADIKLDVTWGLKFDSGRMLILQVQSGMPYGKNPFARFAPSMVFPLTKTFKAEAGVSYGLVGDTAMGIKLGMWAEF